MNQALQQLAELANAYKQQYETGQLSSSEYKELVNDLNLSNEIYEPTN